MNSRWAAGVFRATARPSWSASSDVVRRAARLDVEDRPRRQLARFAARPALSPVCRLRSSTRRRSCRRRERRPSRSPRSLLPGVSAACGCRTRFPRRALFLTKRADKCHRAWSWMAPRRPQKTNNGLRPRKPNWTTAAFATTSAPTRNIFWPAAGRSTTAQSTTRRSKTSWEHRSPWRWIAAIGRSTAGGRGKRPLRREVSPDDHRPKSVRVDSSRDDCRGSRFVDAIAAGRRSGRILQNGLAFPWDRGGLRSATAIPFGAAEQAIEKGVAH